ncbi:AEC family transporter [Pseudidiomarina taiwanensis]|uniref:Malate permease n=1 Tax=Pseudidiomarina taiwanensis TaxID=337250 RepID=A0A432ZCJ2_9GAMM|nr:AEC family transporter [Pseudidiomarina taiwanensis]RUO75675.1 hypothetical protein CWI83_09875 [Pseudidiomarina taiwanensis]
MANLIYIAGFLLIGLLLQRSRQFPQNTGQVLNAYVIYVALPALVLQKIPALTVSTALIIPAIMPWVLLLLTVPVILLLARRLAWSSATTACMLIVVPLGNTSFVGFPMIEALVGEAGIPYALLYDQLGSFLILSIYATFVVAIYASREGQSARPKLRPILLKILRFPPFIALIAALVLKSWDYHPILASFIDSLAVTLVPVIMVAVGFQLKFRLAAEDRQPFVWALVLKLVLTPLVAMLLIWPLGFDSLVHQVTILEAAMPAMISAGALAIMAGLAPTLAAAVVGYGVLLCLVTLPLWAMLLNYLANF